MSLVCEEAGSRLLDKVSLLLDRFYTLFWFPNINSFKTHVNIKFHTVQTAAYTITAITDIKN